MSEDSLYKPSDRARKNSLISENEFQKKYIVSLDNNDDFWAKEAQRIDWIKQF